MRALPLLLISALIVIGCDDEAGTSVNNTTRDASMVMPQTPDMMVTQPMPDTPMPTPDAMVQKKYRLEVQGEAAFTMIFGEMKMISVKYLDENGQAIQNGRVTLNNLDGQMLVTATPGSMANTNTEGVATFTLTANEVAGSVPLTAEALNADPVSWNITIDKRPTGKLSIKVVYSENTGRYRISDIKKARVTLIEGTCDEAFLNVAGRNEINAPMEIDPFTGADFVDIPDLPLNKTFAAVARGVNTNNFAFVQGCTDNAKAELNQVNTVEVALDDQPLEFKGVFDVEHEMNLTCIIETLNDGEFQTFTRVLRLLAIFGRGEGEGDTPRLSALIEYICEIGGEELGFDVPRGLCDVAGGIGGMFLGAPVEAQLDSFVMNLPPSVVTALIGIGDIWRNINRFKVQGQIEFTQAFPDAEGFLRDNDTRWDTFQFVWSQDMNGAACPFDNPEACRRDLPLVDAEGRASPFSGTFTARKLEDKDELYVARHNININYGQLFLVILEQWYLPNQLQKPCMVDADCWAGAVCDNMGEMLCVAQEGAGVPLSVWFEELLCGAGNPIDNILGMGQCASTVAPLAANILRQQLTQSTEGLDALTLDGPVKFADAYPNLKVDWLYQGVWNGQFGDDTDTVDGIGAFQGTRTTERAQAEMTPPEGAMQPVRPINCE